MAKITKENFEEWTRSCGVRNVQSKFDEILQTAKSKNITPEQEMKEQGFKNYQALARACDQFSLCCWPSEFAELGSGFVLYFYFLAFLGTVLCLAFILHIPALATYSGEDWIVGWHWHDWGQGMPWSDNDGACDCIGSTVKSPAKGSIPFTVSEPNYGKTCNEWDLEYCKDKYVAGKAPKWCCVSWCFAEKECPTPEADDSDDNKFEQNMHYFDMVRSLTPCQQSSQKMSSFCSDGKDEAFNEIGVEHASKSMFIGTSWLTPGNFGPDQADNALIPFMCFIFVAALAFLIVLKFQHQIWVDRKVDAGITSPNDFAVLVKGLPKTATDEKSIMEFFSQNGVKGKTDAEVVKVVIGWDIEEFREKIKAVRELQKEIQTLEPTDPKAKELKQKAAEITADLGSAAPDKASRLKSSGVVVVVFRYQADLRACLDRWTSFWARWFYCDANRFCCIDGFLKGAELQKFPIGGVPVARVSVERAPNPGDIHWEELGMGRQETILLFLKTNAFMFLLVLFTGVATWGLNKAGQAAVEAGKSGGAGYKVLSYLPAFGVSICNVIVMISARILGDKEYHETWTSQEFSQAVKMAVALLVNTGGVLLWSNLQPLEWYEKGGLIDDAFTILLVDALVPPFILAIDFKYTIVNRIRRNRLTQEKIDSWNERISSTMGTPEQETARRQVENQVNAFKTFFEPSEIDNPRRYANALNTFIVCLWYSPVLPFTCLIGVAGITLQYWMDKYLLLRWYRRPKRPYNAFLAQLSVRMIKYTVPLGFTICFYFFLSPSWENRQQVLSPFIFALLVSAALIILPSTVLRTILGLRLFCGSWVTDGYNEEDDTAEDYYHAQYGWSKEMKYHKDHFLYKCLPEAKNPEFLKKGEETVTKFDDVKASYGAALDQATTGSSSRVGAALKGGRVIKGGDTLDGRASVTPDASTVASPPPPAPVVDSTAPTYGAAAYGAAAAAAPAPVSYGAYEPDDAPAAAPAPVAPTPHPPKEKQPVWEFSNNHGGFGPFADDCQAYIESKYQEHQSGGQARINVRTGGKKISIDFERMTQMVEGSHKVRQIRRSLQ